jgi:hypothetical protein
VGQERRRPHVAGRGEQPAGFEQLAAQLKGEQDLSTELRRQLDAQIERCKVLEAAAETALSPAAPLDPNHAVVQLARGYLSMIREDATSQAGAAKGGVSGHFLGIARNAKAALDKLEELVPTPKKNGTAAATAPAAEA